MPVGACRKCVEHQENDDEQRDVVRGVPEGGNQSLDHFGRKMETVNDNFGEHVLHVIHESGEHPDNGRTNKKERRIDFDLTEQCSRSLVFPDHVEVRFQAAEREDEGDEKTCCADNSKFADGNVFCVFDDGHDLLGRPVQIEHVNHHGEVVRNKRTEPDRK